MVFEILFQKNPITQKGCLEWPKVQALSSNPSSAKKKQTKPSLGSEHL
jgi:hypothetical protein